jgi:hypothetical protein
LPRRLELELGEGAGTRGTGDLRAYETRESPLEPLSTGKGLGVFCDEEKARLYKKLDQLEHDATFANFQSLERLYARALDRIGTLEQTLTAAQTRNTELVEENRKLKGAPSARLQCACGCYLAFGRSLALGVCHTCRKDYAHDSMLGDGAE